MPRLPGNHSPLQTREEPLSRKPLTLSLLISEWVYRLVVVVERLLRMVDRYLLRPARLQWRCLFW